MSLRYVIDRSGWPSGPWDDEPDEVEWVDKPTGFHCLIRRNTLGGLCGYVGVPSGHQFYNIKGDCLGLKVYGGIKFSGLLLKDDFVVGENIWFFGFDCCHYNDFYPRKFDREGAYRDIKFVKRECESLVSQLAE